MAKQNQNEAGDEAPNLADNMARIAARSQDLLRAFMSRQSEGGGLGVGDPMNVSGAFLDMTAKMMADPAKLVEAQVDLWRSYTELWQHTARRMIGQDSEPLVAPEPGDRRFKDAAWEENAVFDFIKQSYLLTARWMQTTVNDVEGLDEKTARKVDFYTRQFADALAPTNFALTNPEVLRETIESKGENLAKGLENLLADLEAGQGIKMTDPDAFQVGGNIAVSPGQVIFRNDMMELIQYAPTTEKVRARPLLMIPPWINKYYILDLKPKNSLVKWATDQGHTVFMISWVNPDERLADKSFADYMMEGLLAALDAIEKATGEREVTAMALCLGGTLLSATLAYMAATGDERIKAACLMATLVDFAEPGELAVFIDAEQIEALEQRMAESGGTLDGAAMASTFNMLRANDLIWSFVVNNYLMGRDPFPFDLLYWNADSTRMPGKMHGFYLRNMYRDNLLREPGGIELAGVKIDLSKITIPIYVMGAREDHIAPWRSTYAARALFGGPVRFVLAGSGHIAGVVNPPEPGKYPHWTNSHEAKDPEVWLSKAQKHDGSWWPDWCKWNARHAGAMVPARVPGAGALPALAPAPGTYVLEKAR